LALHPACLGGTIPDQCNCLSKSETVCIQKDRGCKTYQVSTVVYAPLTLGMRRIHHTNVVGPLDPDNACLMRLSDCLMGLDPCLIRIQAAALHPLLFPLSARHLGRLPGISAFVEPISCCSSVAGRTIRLAEVRFPRHHVPFWACLPSIMVTSRLSGIPTDTVTIVRLTSIRHFESLTILIPAVPLSFLGFGRSEGQGRPGLG
jgi:hypothetical protein